VGNRFSKVSIITSRTNQAYAVHVCETAVVMQVSANGIVCVCVNWDEKEKQWKRAAVQMPVD